MPTVPNALPRWTTTFMWWIDCGLARNGKNMVTARQRKEAAVLP